jgi:hypothetical protein
MHCKEDFINFTKEIWSSQAHLQTEVPLKLILVLCIYKVMIFFKIHLKVLSLSIIIVSVIDDYEAGWHDS